MYGISQFTILFLIIVHNVSAIAKGEYFLRSDKNNYVLGIPGGGLLFSNLCVRDPSPVMC